MSLRPKGDEEVLPRLNDVITLRWEEVYEEPERALDQLKELTGRY